MRIIYWVFFMLPFGLLGQSTLSWMELTLSSASENPERPGEFVPDFFQGLYDKEGKEVVLTGYVIPLDIETNTYVLSMTPFSNCFFCGQAGVETVVELHFAKTPKRMMTDDYIAVKGIFRLHRKPGTGFIYSLRNASLN